MTTTENKPETKPEKGIVKAEQPNVVANVSKQVRSYVDKGTLHLPTDYSPENALKSAWLTLQEVVDRDKRPALAVCSQVSIANALLDMVVQGLNPAKKQCYFIVYGNKLLCQRSYFGDQAVALRVMPGVELYSAIVYQGDEFEIGMVRGRKTISKHVTKIENQNTSKIVAAYCGLISPDGEDLGAEVMTWEQIQKSWGMSKTYKPGGGGTHGDFPDQMALRTVIRRRCKPIINSSNDALLLASVRRQDDEIIDAEVSEELEHANGEIIDVAPESTEQEAAETPAEEPKKDPF